MEEFKVNRRNKKRFDTELKAQYFLKSQSLRYQECTVINISCTGAAINYYKHERLILGTKIFLKIFDITGFEQIDIEGVLSWITRKGNETICGIKFNEILDDSKFGRLGLTS